LSYREPTLGPNYAERYFKRSPSGEEFSFKPPPNSSFPLALEMSFLSYFRATPVKQGQEGELVVSSEGVDPQKALVDTRTPEEIKEEKRYG